MTTNYFKNMELIGYNFGDEIDPVLFQNISTYIDLVDQLQDQTAFYQDYTIIGGERPDTLSYKLYGDTQYYWTFFLLNEKLRESGWPLPKDEILDFAKLYYPHRTVTTADFIGGDFPVGQQVIGVSSGTEGIIKKRNLDLGQLVIDTTTAFKEETRTLVITPNSNGRYTFSLDEDNEYFNTSNEWVLYKDSIQQSGFSIFPNSLFKEVTIDNISYNPNSVYSLEYVVNIYNTSDDNFGSTESISYIDNETGLTKLVTLRKESTQYNAVHHYEDSNGEWVDINPYSSTDPSFHTPVTVLERLESYNEELKKIKIFRPEVIEGIANEFIRLQRS